ncbi:hypothetical protein Ahy_Scaffold6g108201 [Arachis hypogaea]|uniref:Uncharacterized protein n=1 Tax=Arachis hypogaea TaxID=3818 RepID=A0A444WPK4_ARAHY|nr:hypothetical protein Ahy_Scaffold6g108201 [Arachis hypogaea]
MADVQNKKRHILDPYHKKSPSKERTQLNKFVGYVISMMRVFVGGQPLRKKGDEIEPPYVNIAGQQTHYNCAIYVEVDHFRVEYASLILFDEMNRLRDRAIQESDAIKLSKPSPTLLNPYCQLDS